MERQLWLNLAILLIAIAAGIALRRSGHSSRSTNTTISQETVTIAQLPGVSTAHESTNASTAQPVLDRPRLADVASQMQAGRYRALIAFVQDATAEELQELVNLDAMMDTDHLPAPVPVLGLICPRWIRLDPHGALAYARSLEAQFDSSADWLLETLYAAWLTAAPEKALDSLAKEDAKTVAEIYAACVNGNFDDAAQRLAEAFPHVPHAAEPKPLPPNRNFSPAAQVAQLSQGSSLRVSTALAQQLKLWTAENEAAALSWAHDLEPGPFKQHALATVFTAVIQSEPAEGPTLLAALQPGPARSAFTKELAAQWTPKDPTAAIEWYHSLPENGVDRSEAFTGLVEKLSLLDDGFAALEQLMQDLDWHVPSPGSVDATTHLIDHISQTDPKRAASLAGKLNNRRALNSILSNWFTIDPSTALRWAQEMPSEQFNGFVGPPVSLTFGDDPFNDAARLKIPPLELAALLESLPENDNGFRKASLEQVMGEWTQTSPEEASTWLNHYQGTDSQSLLYTLLDSWAYRDPPAVMSRLDQLVDFGSRKAVVGSISDGIRSNQSEKAAVEWLHDNVPADIAVATLPELIAEWSLVEREAAARWALELPQGAIRNASAAGIAQQLSQTRKTADFEDAVRWVQSIDNSERHAETLLTVFAQWNEMDSAAAAQHLESLQLEESTMEHIIDGLSP